MSEYDALYRAILADPDDDAARLVFADFVEESGDEKRARFIRRQVELARAADHDRAFLWARHLEPEYLTGFDFRHELPPMPAGLDWGFPAIGRGFPCNIVVLDDAAYRRGAKNLFAAHPIQGLTWYCAATPTEPPFLSRFRRVGFHRAGLDASAVIALARDFAPAVDATFSNGGIRSDGLAALFRPEILTKFRSLNLGDNRDVDWSQLAGYRADAEPGKLESLDFSRSGAPGSFVGMLAERNLVGGLRVLRLDGVNVTGDVMRSVARSQHLAGLESLSMASVNLSRQGVAALTSSPHLTHLRELDLSSNRLGPVAAGRLARWRGLRSVRVLRLNFHVFGDKATRTLLTSPNLGPLDVLELNSSSHGDEIGALLLELPNVKDVVHLRLSSNELSPPMQSRLRERFGLRVRL